MKNIAIYSASYCTNCKLIKMFMDAKGIEYKTKDIEINEEYKTELTSKGFMSIPVLEINGECYSVNSSNFKEYLKDVL